jgi:hypothetical protein
MLLLIAQLLRKLMARERARRVARWWIAELDQLADDWEGSELLWGYIALWTEADPVNHREFLILFREYRRWKDATSSSDGELPDAPAGC